MLGAVRVTDTGVLQPYEMLNLGKINVICGRNNSGKSTLVGALADPSRRSAGKPLGEDDLSVVQTAALRGTGWHGGDSHRYENRIVEDLVKAVVEERIFWFRSDDKHFAAELEQRFRAAPGLSQWAFSASPAGDALAQLIGPEPSAIVVPPKRTLELSRGVNLGENVTPAGAGLLNYLFFARNQPKGSIDNAVYERIADAFVRISDGYTFQVFPDRANTIAINFSSAGRGWIRAEDCGLGLQDLLVILYFAIHPAAELVLIEEPESHLHPEMQRRLLLFLRDDIDKQFFLTTHSNVFLNNALIDRVFFTSFDGKISIDDATSRASILDDLGYAVTDNLVSDLVILVEGPTDVPVIEEFLLKAGLYDRGDIKIWPLGGDIMDQLDLSVFAERYTIIALLDQDPGSAAVRRRFEKRCKEVGIPVYKLKRYAIENYFSLRALKEVLGAQIPSQLTSLNPDAKVESQIGINVKRNNRRLARSMTMEEILETDFAAFIRKVERLLPT